MNKQKFHEQYGAWAVITGASDGIGMAFANTLAESGFNLVLAARREEALNSLAKELSSKHNIQTDVVVVDFSSSEAALKLYQRTKGKDIGLLIAAAGFGTSGDFLDNSVQEELSMMDVNCRAVIALSHYYGTQMKNQGRGGIILFSSLVAFQGVPRAANYAATKAFIQSFVEGWYYEMKSFGVDILVIAPGPIRSGFGTRARMKMGMSAKPSVVPHESLNALGKKIIVRPGFLSKFLEMSLKIAPRRLRIRIMAQIMKGMTPRT